MVSFYPPVEFYIVKLFSCSEIFADDLIIPHVLLSHGVWQREATWYTLKWIYIYIYKHDIYHILSRYFWHMYLAYLMAFYLIYLRRFFVVDLRRGTLCSGAHGWGPAGNTLIRAGNTLILSFWWRFGGESLWSGACPGGLAGTLWSRGCCWVRGEHCNLELAVEVWRRKEEGRRKEGRGRLT